MVSPVARGWYFTAVSEGAQDALSAGGYDILRYGLTDVETSRRRVIDTQLLRKRVDGLIVLSLPLTAAEVAALGVMGRPVIVVGPVMSGLPSVRIDDVEVGRLGTQHLVDLGHRRIAFVGGNPDDHLGFPVAPDRQQGYQEVLCAAGVEVDPSLTVPAKFTTAAGVSAWTALGRCDPLPSAVVAASDEIAMGLIYAARRAGVRVPEDLSVIGVDDHDMAWLFDLTTVAQPVRDQGRIAARTLLEQLRAGGPPEPHVTTVPVELIVRGTTAAPAERSRPRSRSVSPC